MPNTHHLSITKLAETIQQGRLTAIEVAQAFIDRIQAVNPVINAVQQFNPARILEQAKQADKLLENGDCVGRLHGVPITLKDTCHIKGFDCSKGFPGFLGDESTYDATVVSRLKSEGAIILGITNVPELLISYETDNLIYGRTNNPYDLNRTPGGSSGGEAAIIAAAGSPGGIGSDAGGSVRQPAHYSGICSHKPTHGLVPLTGNYPFDSSGLVTKLLHFGPMSRHVEDLELLMEIISGSDGIDPHVTPQRFKKPQNTHLGDLRIGYFYHNDQTQACNDTIKTIDRAIETIKPFVSAIKKAYPEPLKDTYKLHWETFVLGGDGGQAIKQLFDSYGQETMSYLTQSFMDRAKKCAFSAQDLRKRFYEVEKYRFDMMRFMKDFDVIISPVATTPARYHGDTHANLHDFSYVQAHNLTGWPATVVPCGRSQQGLPIGIQIASTPWNDHLCLALAKKLQALLGTCSLPDLSHLT